MTRSFVSAGTASIHDGDEVAPDEMLPTQYADLLGRAREPTPELRLMAAVLEDGMRTFCRFAGARHGRARALFREAAEWFDSPDASWPFAFENVCAGLGLEPEWIRRLLRRWEARTVGAPALSEGAVAASRNAVTAHAPGLPFLTRVA